MKKRYFLAGLGALASAGVAWKLYSRERETDFEKNAESLPFAENSKFAEVDGVRVHYQEFGAANGKPILMIHGYSASTYTWNKVAPLFAENGLRVFIVDLVGFGFSQKPVWFDYTIDAQARVIARLMNRLGVGRATLVGSSYGGAVAAAVALDDAERIEKLVLVGAVVNDEIRKTLVVKVGSLPFLSGVITPFLAGSKTYMRARMRNSIDKTNHDLIDGERVAAIMRPLQSADAHNALVSTLKNWSASRIEQNAARIKQPTLLIWGENDRIVPPRNGERMHELLPNSKLVVFDNCGHIPQEERTADFVNLVTDFVQDSKFAVQSQNGF